MAYQEDTLDPVSLSWKRTSRVLQQVNKNFMKKKLKDAKGLWLEILPEVLGGYRTTPKTSTGEMPYSLVYGTEVVISVEVGEPSIRYSHESDTSNSKSRRQELDERTKRYGLHKNGHPKTTSRTLLQQESKGQAT
ncbi:PREDICTED: uncharacterized protein LOC109207810 [Nicotiana attenuata]|uniref:uncharacterized protein LOC109207810 n=1 Tax=Nicotiana attenuata TaxID=49451 RepID=UPI000904A7A4|nr:PREDICTED: uncharacterized protein LOC109207810 [Nicotiana attenuata]